MVPHDVKYSDLHNLTENQRIRFIGEAAMAGNIVGISLEDDEVKIARYLKKLLRRFPTVRLIDRHQGLSPDSVLLKVGPVAKH